VKDSPKFQVIDRREPFHGPPRKPLREIEVTVTANEVIIG